MKNISGLSCRTITRAGRSPERSHQSSLCSPRDHSSGAIYPHIPHAPKIALRPPIKNIGRSLIPRVGSWNTLTFDKPLHSSRIEDTAETSDFFDRNIRRRTDPQSKFNAMTALTQRNLSQACRPLISQRDSVTDSDVALLLAPYRHIPRVLETSRTPIRKIGRRLYPCGRRLEAGTH